MEHWNDGILGTFVFHLVEKIFGKWDKQIMDQKTSTEDLKNSEFGIYITRLMSVQECS